MRHCWVVAARFGALAWAAVAGWASAQQPCVPAPLFSGNVALNMPNIPEQPNAPLEMHSVTHGDFDNDGDIDVIRGSDFRSLVYSRCRGDWWDFDPPVVTNLPFLPLPAGGIWPVTALAVGDFNEDGKPDLAIGDTWIYWQITPSPAQRVHVMLGNGDGTFQAATHWGPVIAAGVGDLCIRDFNGDGHTDIGYGSDEGNNPDAVSILWGTGTGSFPTFTQIYTGVVRPGSAWLDAANIDGDGDEDVVAGAPSNPPTLVAEPAILRNTGNGTFATEPLGTIPSNPFGHTFGELNGDGRPDLVFGGPPTPFAPYVLYLRLNNGTGQFAPHTPYSTTTQINFLDIGSDPLVTDLDGDGRGEVIVVRRNATCAATWFLDQLLVFHNAGNGTLEQPPALYHNVGAIDDWAYLSAADLNQDGRADLIASTEPCTTLLLNEGDGTFVTCRGVRMGQSMAGICGTSGIAAGNFILSTPSDMNSDGRVDLVTVREQTPFLECSVMLQDAQGAFTDLHSAPLPERFTTGLVVADFDRDGNPDVAVSTQTSVPPNYTGGRKIRVALGNGDGTLDAWVDYETVGQNPRHLAASDLNGDSWPDIVVPTRWGPDYPQNPEQSGGVSVLLNNQNGTFAPAVHYDTDDECNWVAIGRVNPDAHADLAVVNSNASMPGGELGYVKILLNDGNGVFTLTAPVYNFNPAAGTASAFLSDVNEDGHNDLLAAMKPSPFVANSGGVTIALNDGTGLFTELGTVGVTWDLTRTVIADLNTDGHVDMLGVTRLSGLHSGFATVWPGNGDGTFGSAISYGGASHYPIVADFDGDGRQDVGSGKGCSPDTDSNTHVGFCITFNRTCPACYPDCNQSSSLTVADFTCFQSKFVAGDPYADCNQSGTLTVADFTCFQTRFVAGCP